MNVSNSNIEEDMSDEVQSDETIKEYGKDY